MSALRALQVGLYWLASFFAYFVIVIFIGAVLGAVSFALVGALTNPDLDLSYRLAKGVINGAQLAGVWATGIAIVLCFIQGRRRNRRLLRADGKEPAA